jgi:integrase
MRKSHTKIRLFSARQYKTYAWTAIRKRAKAAGFLTPVGCHTWRATGITIYLENDGRLEHAQQMAGHESPRTTKLYDRTKDEITLSEVERIRL